MIDLGWFNIHTPLHSGYLMGRYRLSLRLFEVFNRRSTWGHFWGLNVLQIGRRHFLLISFNAIQVLFVKIWERD